MTVTFHNVTISIEAVDPKSAYTQLCDVLSKLRDVEWTTDTYSVGDDGEEKSTEELWPQ